MATIIDMTTYEIVRQPATTDDRSAEMFRRERGPELNVGVMENVVTNPLPGTLAEVNVDDFLDEMSRYSH